MLSKDDRERVEKALYSGNVDSIYKAIGQIKDKGLQKQTLFNVTGFIGKVKDTDKLGEYLDAAKYQTSKQAAEIKKNLFHLLKLDYIDEKEKDKILQLWSKGDEGGVLQEIHKYNKNIGISDLKQIEKMVEAPRVFGLKGQQKLDEFAKISKATEDQKTTALVMYSKEQTKLLTQIADNTNPKKVAKAIANEM